MCVFVCAVGGDQMFYLGKRTRCRGKVQSASRAVESRGRPTRKEPGDSVRFLLDHRSRFQFRFHLRLVGPSIGAEARGPSFRSCSLAAFWLPLVTRSSLESCLDKLCARTNAAQSRAHKESAQNGTKQEEQLSQRHILCERIPSAVIREATFRAQRRHFVRPFGLPEPGCSSLDCNSTAAPGPSLVGREMGEESGVRMPTRTSERVSRLIASLHLCAPAATSPPADRRLRVGSLRVISSPPLVVCIRVLVVSSAESRSLGSRSRFKFSGALGVACSAGRKRLRPHSHMDLRSRRAQFTQSADHDGTARDERAALARRAFVVLCAARPLGERGAQSFAKGAQRAGRVAQKLALCSRRPPARIARLGANNPNDDDNGNNELNWENNWQKCNNNAHCEPTRERRMGSQHKKRVGSGEGASLACFFLAFFCCERRSRAAARGSAPKMEGQVVIRVPIMQ